MPGSVVLFVMFNRLKVHKYFYHQSPLEVSSISLECCLLKEKAIEATWQVDKIQKNYCSHLGLGTQLIFLQDVEEDTFCMDFIGPLRYDPLKITLNWTKL